jgi:hypothetical protein
MRARAQTAAKTLSVQSDASLYCCSAVLLRQATGTLDQKSTHVQNMRKFPDNPN